MYSSRSLRPLRLALLGLALALGAAPAAPLPIAPEDAFRQPLGPLTEDQRARFALGKQLFENDWALAPGPRPGLDGIGPFFDRLSCDGCHTLAGRGEPPRAPDFPMVGMIVRLSIPGHAANGAPLPHPAYGYQLDRNAVAGVPIEGQAFVRYSEEPGRYADGARYSLRRPHYRFAELGYGPLGKSTLISVRVAPQLAGLGLLEAVPDAALITSGRGAPNRVAAVGASALALGRFGWKAAVPSLRQQIASALTLDIGITNPLYPANDCTAVERACLAMAAAATRHPKIEAARLEAIVFYIAHLAPPARHHLDAPSVRTGERLFAQAGCAACHRPTLVTGDAADPLLAHRTIRPYSDLLLHDMGAGLADGRPEFAASGRSWRTPPLWGLGQIAIVNGHEFLLHDGRARGPAEAILWHGGEAKSARDAFRALSKEERVALLTFLDSL
jgi:CxxC motif-containing protein (DUF1111 family)